MILSPLARYLSRYLALAYVLVLVVVPVGLILVRTFEPGIGAFFASITTPAAISALNLSLLVVAIVGSLGRQTANLARTPAESIRVSARRRDACKRGSANAGGVGAGAQEGGRRRPMTHRDGARLKSRN